MCVMVLISQMMNLALPDDMEMRTTSSGRRARTTYNFLGFEIGIDCFVALLGTTKDRLYKCMGGKQDERFGAVQERAPKKTRSCHRYYFSKWLRDGQTIPERFSCSDVVACDSTVANTIRIFKAIKPKHVDTSFMDPWPKILVHM
jgi:hypothetical protein